MEAVGFAEIESDEVTVPSLFAHAGWLERVAIGEGVRAARTVGVKLFAINPRTSAMLPMPRGGGGGCLSSRPRVQSRRATQRPG